MCVSPFLRIESADDEAGDGGEEKACSFCGPKRGVSSTRLFVHEHTLQSYQCRIFILEVARYCCALLVCDGMWSFWRSYGKLWFYVAGMDLLYPRISGRMMWYYMVLRGVALGNSRHWCLRFAGYHSLSNEMAAIIARAFLLARVCAVLL